MILKRGFYNPTNIINANVCEDVRMFVTLSCKNYLTDRDEIWYRGKLSSGITHRIG